MRKPYCVNLEESNHKAVKILAAEKGCSIADIMNILIEKYLGSNTEK